MYTQTAEDNNLDIDEGNNTLCNACLLPLFSTPFVTSNDNNNSESGSSLVLHRGCKDLGAQITYHGHPNNPLQLLRHYTEATWCEICFNPSKGFVYQCPDSLCRYSIDVACATPYSGMIRVNHRSHIHEMFYMSDVRMKEECEVCKSRSEGDFYWCRECSYGIHRNCALMPNIIRHSIHPHPLILVYNMPIGALTFLRISNDLKGCLVCGKSSSDHVVYFCTTCSAVVHISCLDMKDCRSFSKVPIQELVKSITHLPMVDEKKSLMNYCFDNASSNILDRHNDNIHDHPLILHDKDNEEDAESVMNLCNACIQPIIPPFYTCSNPQCTDFFLHKCCTNRPLYLKHVQDVQHFDSYYSGPSGCKSLKLHSKYPGEFFGMLRCLACSVYCNGSVYCSDECRHTFDIQCATLPRVITHQSHNKSHILFLASDPGLSNPNFACCGRREIVGLYYICGSCPNYAVHVRCSLLPSTVSHKFDSHPLQLIMDPKISTTKMDDFCGICEENMNKSNFNWFYGCKECEQSFHIDCIPCVGQYSKIKFGGSIRLSCHDCPLTSYRLLTSYSYECGLCKETIGGKKDGIAFECSKCDFRMHYECAESQCIPHVEFQPQEPENKQHAKKTKELTRLRNKLFDYNFS